jgi:predicted CXXCH cytochrome family protein
MKKQTALLAVVALAASATAAFGLGSIVGSPHDLKGTYGTGSLGADEICIYCHTPHNPVQAIPLWNRNNPSASLFTLYKTSPTLTAATQASAFTSGSVSVFCMSCHDGVTALGNIKNAMAHTMDTTTVISSANNDNLGQNLTNSHPVGFNYANAQGADGTLHPIATAAASLGTATGGSYPFFNDSVNSVGQMMECASCHKVHDNEYGKFLRKDNAGSALCLACHKK